jgi:hypothetical protein
MSKLTLTGVIAVLGLTFLAGCQQPAPEPEPVQPIYMEPVRGKAG